MIQIYLPDRCDPASITKLTLDQGLKLATQRLEHFGFIVSNTQPQTPKDGNCFCHSAADQMKSDVHLKSLNYSYADIRSETVNKADFVTKRCNLTTDCIEHPKANSKKSLSFEEWKVLMAKEGQYCDQLFLQIFAENFNKKLVVIPVFKTQGDSDTGIIEIVPEVESGEPFHFLYYSEARFLSPHYQSIMKVNT